MSWWAEIDVILGALCKQQGKRQTVTSGSHIIPTTWSIFAWACGGFGPGMHVWFHCMSTSFASRKGPNESCTFIRVNFSNVLCLVECLSCWFCRKMGHFERDETKHTWTLLAKRFQTSHPVLCQADSSSGAGCKQRKRQHLTLDLTCNISLSWAEETLWCN